MAGDSSEAPVAVTAAAAAAILLPVGYCLACARSNVETATGRGFALYVAAAWIAFLGIPFWLDQMPVRSASTMIASVLCFIMPLKLTHLALCYDVGGETSDAATKKKTDDDAAAKTDILARPGLREFLKFAGSFLYYAAPISWNKKPPNNRNSWRRLLLKNAEYLAVILLKICLLPVIEAAMQRLAENDNDDHKSTVNYFQLLVLFTWQVVAMSWVQDAQCLFVSLASAGRLEMLPMHEYPFAAKSLSEFWGKRFNRLINCLLKETVYVPAQNVLNCSKGTAQMLAFATSGALHTWVAHWTFGYGTMRALAFFVLQGAWMLAIESPSPSSASTRPVSSTGGLAIRALASWAFFYATLPLYGGLFVEAMPDWLEKNPTGGEVPSIPIVWDTTQWLVAALGLQEEQ